MFYPLHAFVCANCLLVQLDEFESPDAIFSDYAYFSSYSQSWLEHARAYCRDDDRRASASTHDSQVIEIASNDGYLLQYFVAAGIPVLGHRAGRQRRRGRRRRRASRPWWRSSAPIVARALVAGGKRADLLIGNNVLAHVPDLNDFVAGLAIVLAADGVITMEFPHLLRLIEHNQFDTIYHEHFSYFSFLTVTRVFAAHGLRLFDVEQLRPTAGRCGSSPATPSVAGTSRRRRRVRDAGGRRAGGRSRSTSTATSASPSGCSAQAQPAAIS